MAKNTKPTTNTVVYQKTVDTAYGKVDVILDIKEKDKKLPSWIQHLKIRREITDDISNDPVIVKQSERAYKADRFVKAYMETGVPYAKAVEYARKTYNTMFQEAQIQAISVLLVNTMFSEGYVDGNKQIVLAPHMIPFDINPEHYTSPHNEAREEIGEPLIPTYDSNSVIEQKIAYIATLAELDPGFQTVLNEAVGEALQKLGEQTSETDEDGFQSK